MSPPTAWLYAYLLSQFAVASIQAHANTLADVHRAPAACVSTACRLYKQDSFEGSLDKVDSREKGYNEVTFLTVLFLDNLD